MLDYGRTRFATVLLAVGLATGAVAADAFEYEAQLVPDRYNRLSLDGPLISLTNPVDGRTWSAWAYRDGAEYDIAIAFREPAGPWSEPVFLGRLDGRDQVEPAMTADADGNLYLAYTDRGTGAILLTVLSAGADTWFDPTPVTGEGERGFTPSLRVVADRLVLAYRSGWSIVIRDLALLGPPTPVSPDSIWDSPDPYGDQEGDGGVQAPGD
jgi:hypothetical protein